MSSGSRFYNFREGDRSEYLAVYFFSALGLVTTVPRQEDIGFDLVCSIADQEVGRLTFNDQYLVSVKSLSTPDIVLLPAKSDEDEAKEKTDESYAHISWLFRNELTLLLAVVDKETQTIRVYSTLPTWFIYYENRHECAAMTLRPRIDGVEGHPNVDRPQRIGDVKGFPGCGHYEVDLGYPILTATLSELLDKDKIRAMKMRLRFAIMFGRMSILNAQLGTPYFYWFAVTYLDETCPRAGFFGNQMPDVPEAQKQVYSMIAPTLISLALLYKTKKDTDSFNAVMHLMKSVPEKFIAPEVRQELGM